jgi:TatD DNase family protein
MFDAHCHLSFSPHATKLAQWVCTQSSMQPTAGAITCTLNPDGFYGASKLFTPYDNVHVACGLHPWTICAQDLSATEDDTRALIDCIADSPFIGEVGLDFAEGALRRAETGAAAAREAQVQTLGAIVQAVATSPSPKIMSIHCINAVDALLDVLPNANFDNGSVAIVHRFAGTSDELVRLRNEGFWFSFGLQNLRTRRGVAYVRQLPKERLLAETDLAQKEGDDLTVADYAEALRATYVKFTEIWDEDAARTLDQNAARLLARVLQSGNK